MEKTITFEMPEDEVKSFEKMLDETLKVLRRIEKENPKREARIARTQTETKKIKEDIQKHLAILTKRNEYPTTV
jgi:peptidoglycan hydrolase CwlO-like protein